MLSAATAWKHATPAMEDNDDDTHRTRTTAGSPGPPALVRAAPWVLRATWAVLAVSAGPAYGDALAGRSRPVQVVAATGLWTAWGAGLLASLVFMPIALTALRLLAPAALASSLAAGIAGNPTVAVAVAIGSTTVACGLALLPEIGAQFVNGPAYPNERRHLLAPPGPLLVGPIEAAWLAATVLPATAALALASRSWLLGGVLTAAAVPLAVLGARSLHGLSERWLVFVPAGIVLKDPLTLVDPVLFRRAEVAALRPAPKDSDSLDLTMGARGLAIELLLVEKVPMVLVKARERAGEHGRSARLLFTPSRPGMVLADARTRHLA